MEFEGVHLTKKSGCCAFGDLLGFVFFSSSFHLSWKREQQKPGQAPCLCGPRRRRKMPLSQHSRGTALEVCSALDPSPWLGGGARHLRPVLTCPAPASVGGGPSLPKATGTLQGGRTQRDGPGCLLWTVGLLDDAAEWFVAGARDWSSSPWDT